MRMVKEKVKELKNNFNELKEDIRKDDIESEKTIRALKAYNNQLQKRLQVVEAKKAGMFLAFDYKNMQMYADSLEEERNSLREKNKKLEEDNQIMKEFIDTIKDSCPF